jgi:transposase
MLMAPPKKYPDELRIRAVELWRDSNPRPPIVQLARDLDVHPEALRTWIRQDEIERGERPDPRAERLSETEAEELQRLRAENAELRRVNEILTAASAFFASQLDQQRRLL